MMFVLLLVMEIGRVAIGIGGRSSSGSSVRKNGFLGLRHNPNGVIVLICRKEIEKRGRERIARRVNYCQIV